MLNEFDVKKLFNKNDKIERALVTQTETKYCASFIRNKLMLRYKFETAILLVRNDIAHKIEAEKPSLIQNALIELCNLEYNIEKKNIPFFQDKTLSELIPNYMTLINYVGIPTKKSKVCIRIKNYLTIFNKYMKNEIELYILLNETKIQKEALKRIINIYTKSEPEDIIVFILRYDIKK